MNRTLVVLAGAGVLVACQDAGRRDVPVTGPSFDISEARFGGNPDFFFSSPLAAPPSGPNLDAGGSNGLLRPSVRICETDGVNACTPVFPDVTLAVTGSATGLVMTYNSTAELYQVNWQTKLLDLAKNYRIEVWGLAVTAAQAAAARASAPGTATLDQRWLFGWRDIQNSPSVASCDGTELSGFCQINYGKTLPVKVRIEQFVFCPVAMNCAVQFVAAGVDANLEATGASSAQLFIPGQTGTDFAVAFLPCTDTENTAVSNAFDAPTFGPCYRSVAPFAETLDEEATLSLCGTFLPSGFDDSELANSGQRALLALHHFSSDLSQVKALPEALPNCGAIASAAPSKGLLRLAFAVRDKVLALVTPRPLMAAARRIDEGGGGETSEVGSFFKLALPAKFEYEFEDDASQTGMAGDPFTLRVKVTDVRGDPVLNARVHWTAVTPPAEGATVLGCAAVLVAGICPPAPAPSPTFTDASGIAQNTVTLSSSRGFNVFHAFGRGIADPRETGCTIPTIPPTIPPNTSALCNGPRTEYDPFQPIHLDAVPPLDLSGIEAILDIPVGTFLPFTVFGRGRR